MSIGVTQLILIMVIGILLFGNIPKIFKDVGTGIQVFKKQASLEDKAAGIESNAESRNQDAAGDAEGLKKRHDQDAAGNVEGQKGKNPGADSSFEKKKEASTQA